MTDSPIDPGDMLANRQAQDAARSQEFYDSTVGVHIAPDPVVDPTNRNLAMQLAIQRMPNSDIGTLKNLADEFYSYLTQQS